MQDLQNKGWVRLYRKLEDNDLWLAEPFTRGQAWVDILLLANHKERSVFIRGNEVKIERGQFIHSEETLSARWKWSRGKTRSFLALLESRGMLDNRKSRLCAIRTVLNYVEYQKTEQQTIQQTGQQKAIRPDNRQDTNKNGKNERMREIPDSEAALIAPTPSQEALAFFQDPKAQENCSVYMASKGVDRATSDREIAKFVRYWTEPTNNGKKQRWELQKTFEVRRRLVTWFGNLNKSAPHFNSQQKGMIL